MMIDDLQQFCDDTDVGTSTGVANVGVRIDLGSATPGDIGNGQPLWLVIAVGTTFTSGGSAVVQFKLASDSVTSLAVDGSATDHIRTDSLPVASCTAGTVLLCTPLPGGSATDAFPYERYLGIQQNITTAALTGGTVNAFLTPNPQRWQALPAVTGA